METKQWKALNAVLGNSLYSVDQQALKDLQNGCEGVSSVFQGDNKNDFGR